MTPLRRMLRDLDARVPRSLTRDQILARLLATAAVLAALALTGGPAAVLALGVVSAVAAAVVPEEGGAPAGLAAVLLAWFMGLRTAGDWQTLAVALLVLVQHAALVLATSAPPRSDLPRPVVVRTLRRSAVVGAVTVVVWGLVGAAPPSTPVPAAVAVLALVGLLGALVALTGRR